MHCRATTAHFCAIAKPSASSTMAFIAQLQRAAKDVPPEEHTPELQSLLAFSVGIEAAESQLKAAAQRLQGDDNLNLVQSLEQEPAVFQASRRAIMGAELAWRGNATAGSSDYHPPPPPPAAAAAGRPRHVCNQPVFTLQSPPTPRLQALVAFVRAVALGAEAAGVCMCSAAVVAVLQETLLQASGARAISYALSCAVHAALCARLPASVWKLQLGLSCFCIPAASWLQPIVCQEADGSIQAYRPSDGEHTSGRGAEGVRQHTSGRGVLSRVEAASTPRPSFNGCIHAHAHALPHAKPGTCLPACLPLPHAAVCPEPTPTNLVQLLAAGIYLHLTGNPEPAISMLSAVLTGVWPAPRCMQRQLAVSQFVPSLECGGISNGGSSSAVRSGASSSSSKGPTDRAEAAHRAASVASSIPSSSSSSSSSRQQADAEVEEGAPTQLAADLAAALERHCPGIKLADLHKAALQLRLFFGCRSVAAQAAAGPSPQATLPGLQAVVRTLLLDCQQLLAADPACMHTYVWAAELLLYALWPVDRERQAVLFQEGLRRSRDAKCECRGMGRCLSATAASVVMVLHANVQRHCCLHTPPPRPTCVPARRLAGGGRGGSRLRAVAAGRAGQRRQCGSAPGGPAGGQAAARCDQRGGRAPECLAARWPPNAAQPAAAAAGRHSAGDAGRGAAAAGWVLPAC